MKPKRLLVVTDEMEVGGSQRQISFLLSGLDRSQWEPELLFFRKESFMAQALRAQDITVHQLPKRGRFDPGFVLRYAALLRRGRYDVVHAYSLTAELWTAIARMFVRRAPSQVSSVRNLHLGQSRLFWMLKRFALGRSAAIITNSRIAAEHTAQHVGMDPSRFEFVANGVAPVEPMPPHERDALRRAIGVPAGRCFGLFVGRLVKQKNVPCLIRAMAALQPHERPWIALAGWGPLHDEITRLRSEAGLEADLHLLGERSDAVDLMKAADFLVLPSLHEGMSNVLMEAMSVACPVVASEVGGAPELIDHGRTGLLFRSDDSAALAMHLRRITADADLRIRLSAASAEHIRNSYSIDQLVKGTVAVYERGIQTRGRRGTPSSLATVQAGRLGEDA